MLTGGYISTRTQSLSPVNRALCEGHSLIFVHEDYRSPAATQRILAADARNTVV